MKLSQDFLVIINNRSNYCRKPIIARILRKTRHENYLYAAILYKERDIQIKWTNNKTEHSSRELNVRSEDSASTHFRFSSLNFDLSSSVIDRVLSAHSLPVPLSRRYRLFPPPSSSLTRSLRCRRRRLHRRRWTGLVLLSVVREPLCHVCRNLAAILVSIGTG